ncbi:hypothetical protein [Sphingobacterium kitahiroshimense]
MKKILDMNIFPDQDTIGITMRNVGQVNAFYIFIFVVIKCGGGGA